MYGGGQGHLIFILSLKTNAPRPPPSTGHVESVGTLEEWINYRGFLELRLCPCYNLMPRDLFENMNCIEGAYTLSQQYLHCQAVDNAALAAVWPGGITSVRAPCSPPLPVLPTSTVSLCTCYCVGGRGVEPPRMLLGAHLGLALPVASANATKQGRVTNRELAGLHGPNVPHV